MVRRQEDGTISLKRIGSSVFSLFILSKWAREMEWGMGTFDIERALERGGIHLISGN